MQCFGGKAPITKRQNNSPMELYTQYNISFLTNYSSSEDPRIVKTKRFQKGVTMREAVTFLTSH